MKRYNSEIFEHEENEKVDAFIADIKTVFEKHKMAITLDEYYNDYLVIPLNEELIDAIKTAGFDLKDF